VAYGLRLFVARRGRRRSVCGALVVCGEDGKAGSSTTRRCRSGFGRNDKFDSVAVAPASVGMAAAKVQS